MTSQIVNKVDAGWFIRCRRSRIPLLDGNAGHTPSNRLTIIVRNISWFARRIAQRKPVLWPRSCPQRHRPMGRRLQQFPATLVAGISPPGGLCWIHRRNRGSNAAQYENLVSPPVATTTPIGLFKTTEAPIAVGRKFSGRSTHKHDALVPRF